jgi:uncharacterized protein
MTDAMHGERVTLPARTGQAVRLAPGATITIVNPAGTQVVDTWAVNAADPKEFLSVEHSRAVLMRVTPLVGDVLVTNLRRPILRLTGDTTPGAHDTLIPACDPERYRQLGAVGHHASCAENFASATSAVGIDAGRVPNPLNLFMNVPWTSAGELTFAAPTSRPGDSVTLQAEIDVWLIMSACPQDMVPVNGADNEPADVEYVVSHQGKL